MNSRIAFLRKNKKMNQAELADKLKLSRNYVSLIETGERFPSDRTISDICRIFGANEVWLRTGEGEPYKALTKKEALTNFFDEVLNDEDDKSFKVQVIELLSQLDEDDWQFLAKLADKLISQCEEHEEENETELYELKPFA